MSKEDKEWLEKAMQEYTFNDADRLKEICDQMRDDVAGNFTGAAGGGQPEEGEQKAEEQQVGEQPEGQDQE